PKTIDGKGKQRKGTRAARRRNDAPCPKLWRIVYEKKAVPRGRPCQTKEWNLRASPLREPSSAQRPSASAAAPPCPSAGPPASATAAASRDLSRGSLPGGAGGSCTSTPRSSPA